MSEPILSNNKIQQNNTDFRGFYKIDNQDLFCSSHVKKESRKSLENLTSRISKPTLLRVTVMSTLPGGAGLSQTGPWVVELDVVLWCSVAVCTRRAPAPGAVQLTGSGRSVAGRLQCITTRRACLLPRTAGNNINICEAENRPMAMRRFLCCTGQPGQARQSELSGDTVPCPGTVTDKLQHLDNVLDFFNNSSTWSNLSLKTTWPELKNMNTTAGGGSRYENLQKALIGVHLGVALGVEYCVTHKTHSRHYKIYKKVEEAAEARNTLEGTKYPEMYKIEEMLTSQPPPRQRIKPSRSEDIPPPPPPPAGDAALIISHPHGCIF